MANFLIVDDHPLLRAGLASVLRRATEFAPATVVEAGSRKEAHERLFNEGMPIDLIFYDLNLPDSDGIEGFRTMKAAVPDIPFAIFSAITDCDVVAAAYGAGAAGFLRKGSSVDLLVHGTALILQGGVFIDPTYFYKTFDPARRAAPRALSRVAARASSAQRQQAVLALVRKGHGNKEIAAELGIAEGTVKAYVSALLSRFKVHSRAQLIAALSGTAESGETPSNAD